MSFNISPRAKQLKQHVLLIKRIIQQIQNSYNLLTIQSMQGGSVYSERAEKNETEVTRVQESSQRR